MVKKIGTPTRPGGASPIEKTRTVEGAKVGGVQQVRETESQGRVGRVRRDSIEITPEMEQQLMQIIDEEAEKMFGGEKGLPKSKKETLTGAVKMAIRAGLIEEEEDEEAPTPGKKR